MTTRQQNNFWDSVKLGEAAERELARIMKKKMSGLIDITKVDYKQHGFDLLVDYEKEGIKFSKAIEVKDLAGGYPTGVVEIWADDNKTKRPWWWLKGGCDYIFFKNEKKNLWFMYSAEEVIKFLENYTDHQFRAYNGNKDDSGWLAKFYWDPTNLPADHNPNYVMDGWIMTFPGEKK